MKRIISLTFAVLMLISCLIIPISATIELSEDNHFSATVELSEADPCIDHGATATRYLSHTFYGADCMATTQTYCSKSSCGRIFDTWTAVYTPCIHSQFWN